MSVNVFPVEPSSPDMERAAENVPISPYPVLNTATHPDSLPRPERFPACMDHKVHSDILVENQETFQTPNTTYSWLCKPFH